MTSVRRALLAGLSALAAVAPAASAATAEVMSSDCDPRYGSGCSTELRFAAGPGELRLGDGDDAATVQAGRRLIGTVDSGALIPRLRRGQGFFRCGGGRDIVERADLDDIVVGGCEAVQPEEGLFLLDHPLRPVIGPGKLHSPIIGIANAAHDGRRVVLRIREPRRRGRVLGRTSMRVGVEAFEVGGDRGETARFRMVVRRPAGG